MSRPLGIPKTGGRAKGTPNLKTLVLREALSKVGFDIVQELHLLYPNLDPHMKAKVLMAFLPFLFPKPESVHVTNLRTHEMEKRAGNFSVFETLDGGPIPEDASDDQES